MPTIMLGIVLRYIVPVVLLYITMETANLDPATYLNVAMEALR